MHVEVEHGLSPISVRVYYGSITVLGEPARACYFGSREQQMSKDLLVPTVSSIQRINVISGNDQKMRRSLRIEVRKGDAFIVLIHYVRGDTPIGYLAKYAIVYSHFQLFKLEHRPRYLLTFDLCIRSRTGLSSDRIFLDPLNVRAQGPHLFDNGLIASVNVVHAIDHCFTMGAERREYQ